MEVLDRLQQIGSGPDSRVYVDEYEEDVYKWYTRLVGDPLDWYIGIINSLTDYPDQVIDLTEIEDDEGNTYKVKVRFSPHSRVEGYDNVLTSSYIEGPKLSDIYNYYGNPSFDTQNLGTLLLSTFKGRSFQDKLKFIYQIILSYWIGERLPASIRSTFDSVGIQNVKVVRYGNTVMLYVTDIFPNIERMYNLFTNVSES